MEDLQGRIDLEQALLVYGNQLSHIYSERPWILNKNIFFLFSLKEYNTEVYYLFVLGYCLLGTRGADCVTVSSISFLSVPVR